MSAIAEPCSENDQLRGDDDALRSGVTEADASDSGVCVSSSSTRSGDEDIPLEPLLVLNGKLNDISVRVLKDDGCNTNVISQRVLDLNRQ